MHRTVRHLVIAFIISCLTASGSTFWHNLIRSDSRQSIPSSLVDFLYPNGEEPPESGQTVPNLRPPLQVGLAFLPSRAATVEGLSGADKTILSEEVKRSFANREFLKEIVIIPDTYMRPGRKGFESVARISRL